MKRKHKILIVSAAAASIIGGAAYVYQNPAPEAPAAAPQQVEQRIGPKEAYPDPTMGPGKLMDNLDINATILNSGWRTSSIRPPTSYTNPLKFKQMEDYGDVVPDSNATCMPYSNSPKCYEEDHICSLQIGGDPTSPLNLFPQPYNIFWNGKDVGACIKDKLENYEGRMIKAGNQTPEQACKELSGDWIYYAQKYGILK